MGLTRAVADIALLLLVFHSFLPKFSAFLIELPIFRESHGSQKSTPRTSSSSQSLNRSSRTVNGKHCYYCIVSKDTDATRGLGYEKLCQDSTVCLSRRSGRLPSRRGRFPVCGKPVQKSRGERLLGISAYLNDRFSVG